MIRRPNQNSGLPSFVPKYSDPDIIKSILNSSLWKHLFLGDKQAVWIIFSALVMFKIELFAWPLKAVLRYDHGKRTFGLILIVMSILTIIAFNAITWAGYLASFFPLAAPIVPFFMSDLEILVTLFGFIRSLNLVVFWIILMLISLIHLIRMYKDWGAPVTPESRGHSIIHALIFRRINFSEAFTQRLVEPTLCAIIGYNFYSSESDVAFGIFLMIGAGCLFFQESYDAVMKFSVSQ